MKQSRALQQARAAARRGETHAAIGALRSLAAGAALGFGISAAGGMAAILTRGHWGHTKIAFAIDILRFSSWHLCVLVWILYLLLPEKPVNTSEAVVQMSALEPHSQELQRFLQR